VPRIARKPQSPPLRGAMNQWVRDGGGGGHTIQGRARTRLVADFTMAARWRSGGGGGEEGGQCGCGDTSAQPHTRAQRWVRAWPRSMCRNTRAPATMGSRTSLARHSPQAGTVIHYLLVPTPSSASTQHRSTRRVLRLPAPSPSPHTRNLWSHSHRPHQLNTPDGPSVPHDANRFHRQPRALAAGIQPLPDPHTHASYPSPTQLNPSTGECTQRMQCRSPLPAHQLPAVRLTNPGAPAARGARRVTPLPAQQLPAVRLTNPRTPSACGACRASHDRQHMSSHKAHETSLTAQSPTHTRLTCNGFHLKRRQHRSRIALRLRAPQHKGADPAAYGRANERLDRRHGDRVVQTFTTLSTCEDRVPGQIRPSRHMHCPHGAARVSLCFARADRLSIVFVHDLLFGIPHDQLDCRHNV
jgi:hypothetical protein